MFFSDMERKTLAITPPLLLSSLFFHLRGAAFGSSKAFHCLMLLSCLLLSSVNTLHNLAEYNSCGSNGYNTAAAKVLQGFNGGDFGDVAIQNVCPRSHFFSFLSALGSENHQFDQTFPFFWLSCLNKSWSNSALIGNNLSRVVWLSLRPVHIIEFQPELLSPLHIEDTTCYKPLSKEFYTKKSTGELSVLVSGKHFGGNGFMVSHQCEGFSLEPGDSIKFLFFYQTELSWSSGVTVFAVPMKATAPILMLNLGKKSVLWVRTKKLSIAVLIAAALLILIFCFNDQFIDEKDNQNNCNNHTTLRKAEKSSTITVSPEMDSLLRTISQENAQGFNEVSENTIKPVATVSSMEVETSEAVSNLTVKTTKDKKRRRNKKKKKKGGISSGLTPERTDVSSSYSGNSTPRSPMSPQPPTNQTRTKPVEEPPPPKPVLSHSATFPVYGVKSMMIKGSTLAPNARAPGAKLRTEVREEKEKEYRYYDIWGDHLTGLNLMDRFKEVREGRRSSSFCGDDEFVSFFHNLLPDLCQTGLQVSATNGAT